MEKKENIDLYEIAEENYIEFFSTANGKIIVWIDGTVSFLYGNWQPASPENEYLSLNLCDAGHTIEKAEIEKSADWYIDSLYASMEEIETYLESEKLRR